MTFNPTIPDLAASAQKPDPPLTVVVIDDQSTGRLILAEVIKGIDRKINTLLFSNPLEALDLLQHTAVDLVLTDYKMPQLDGIETIRRLRAQYSYEQLPIVMTTVVSDREVRHNAFEAGATDFLIRPVDPIECRARCHNLLNLRQQYLLNSDHARQLEARVAEVTHALRLRETETLFRLARAVQYRDVANGERLKRVAMHAASIARGLGMPDLEVEVIELAVALHDIGKICMPDRTTLKVAPLTSDEKNLLQDDAGNGNLQATETASRFLQIVASIAVYQYEQYDGSGGPAGLIGQAIPLEARIVALADRVEQLIAAQPLQQPGLSRATRDYLIAQKNRQFDPVLVDIWLSQQVATAIATASLSPQN